MAADRASPLAHRRDCHIVTGAHFSTMPDYLDGATTVEVEVKPNDQRMREQEERRTWCISMP
uniref:Uncharacterized protein n=1 Tax=Oryza sativa subsp. japonica TaxID=39947 RepID=Q5VPV9_ORYSJ|nr:hypothetical protein [Oryza sativa Japonica Group]